MVGGVDKEGRLREVSLMRLCVALGMCYVNEGPQVWYVCLCVHLTDCTQEEITLNALLWLTQDPLTSYKLA